MVNSGLYNQKASPLRNLVRRPPAEVIWNYLAHEHRWKGEHTGIAESFGLVAGKFPPYLSNAAEEIVRAVAGEVALGQCDKAVLDTVNILSGLQWELRAVPAIELGKIHSQLPGEFPPQGRYIPGRQGQVSELLPGWLDYLKLDNDYSRQDADKHKQILEELSGPGLSHRVILRDQLGRTVVGDGKHRLFVAYQHGFDLTV